jgi:hypothetical protein
MKKLFVLVALVLLSCVRGRDSLGAMVGDDKSIVFPDFFQSRANRAGQAQSLDGVTLRALMVASQDLFPPDSSALPCWERLEGYDYRTIRQDDVIFVYIYLNPTRCGRRVLAFDSGVKYAISTDGRILRRVFEGEPEAPLEALGRDAGVESHTREPGLSSIIRTPGDDPSRYLPAAWLDGGTGFDGGQP